MGVGLLTTDEKIQRLWQLGNDTVDIAEKTGLTESEVVRRLQSLRKPK